MKVAVGINYIGCANCCGLFMSRDGFKGHIELCDGDPLKSPCEAFACARRKYLEFIAKETLLELKEGSNSDHIAKIISPKKGKGHRKRDVKRTFRLSNEAYATGIKSVDFNLMDEECYQNDQILEDDQDTIHDKHDELASIVYKTQMDAEQNVDRCNSFNMRLEHDEVYNEKDKETSPVKSKLIKDDEFNIVICSNGIIGKESTNNGLLTTTLDPSLSSCFSGNLLSDQQLSPGGWAPTIPGTTSLSKDNMPDTNTTTSLEPYCVTETILHQELSVPVTEMCPQVSERQKKPDCVINSESDQLMMPVEAFSDQPSSHSLDIENKQNSSCQEPCEADDKMYGYYDVKTEYPTKQCVSVDSCNSGDINKLISQLQQSISTADQTTEFISVHKSTMMISGSSDTNSLQTCKSNCMNENEEYGDPLKETESSGDELVIDESPRIIRYRHRAKKRKSAEINKSKSIKQNPKLTEDKNDSAAQERLNESERSHYESYFDFCGSQKTITETNHKPNKVCVFVNKSPHLFLGNSKGEKMSRNKSFPTCQTIVVYPPGTPIISFKEDVLLDESNMVEYSSVVNLKPHGNPVHTSESDMASEIICKEMDASEDTSDASSKLCADLVLETKTTSVSTQSDQDVCAQTDSVSADDDSLLVKPCEELEKLDVSKVIDKLAPIPIYRNYTDVIEVNKAKHSTKKVKQVYIKAIVAKSAADKSDMKYCETEICGMPVLKRVSKIYTNEKEEKNRPQHTTSLASTDNVEIFELGQTTSNDEPVKSISNINVENRDNNQLIQEKHQRMSSRRNVSPRCLKETRTCKSTSKRKTGLEINIYHADSESETSEKKGISWGKRQKICTRGSCKDVEAREDNTVETLDHQSVSPRHKGRNLPIQMPRDDQYTKDVFDGKNVYICKLCKQKLLSLVKLRNHLSVTHNNGSDFKCEHCNFTTFYRRRWKAHVKRHTKEKYICPYCPTFYIDNSSLNRHINIKHFQQSNYRCGDCGFIAMDNPLLADHMRTHTGEMLVCRFDGCEFKTPSFRAHRDHERRHEPDYLCISCGYSTSNKQTFSNHLETHKGTKSFKCSLCPYRARTKQNVLRHASTVHGAVQTFACDRCSFTTSYQAALTCHIYSHEGLQPFKCSLCEYTSSSTSLIYRHGRAKHQDQKVTAVKILERVRAIKGSDYLNPNLKQFNLDQFDVIEIDLDNTSVNNDPIHKGRRKKQTNEKDILI